MNNVQPIAPNSTLARPEAQAAQLKTGMSAPQVGASEIRLTDSVVAPEKSNRATDSLQATHREMVREWVGSQLEIRPGEVKKGLDWNSDPEYPSLNVLNGIATMFVNSAFIDGKIS
jgi:hypothetical protein